tara:strand:- start:135 stop:797 length:663 start_codon:yes stop_codon:yes gene_type:complete
MFYINSIKKQFFQDLKAIFLENEISSIWNQWVVKEILDMTLIEYFSKGDFLLRKKTLAQIKLLTSHLLSGKPIQYFFKYTYFKGLKIHLNSNVLIPRPETEELVDLVLRYTENMTVNNMIDIGVGSGCISIALKKIINTHCVGIDYCSDILNLAAQNAKYHNVDIDFVLMDILNTNNYNHLSKVDIIVSNPPYVIQRMCLKGQLFFMNLKKLFLSISMTH